MTKKILLVAVDVPPNNNLASVRVTRFGRHLAGLGWQCRVFGSTPLPGPYLSDDMIELLGTDIPIIRSSPFPTARGFTLLERVLPSWLARPIIRQLAFPDASLGWIPPALASLLAQLRSWRPDVVFFTAPHWSTLLLAYLVRRSTVARLVVDLRDPWAEDEHWDGPAWHKGLSRAIQRGLFREAHRVTVTNPYLAELLNKQYRTRRPVVCLPGAYDYAPEEVPALTFPGEGPVVLAYAGKIYPKHSGAKCFLEGLERAARQAPSLEEDLILQYTGPIFHQDLDSRAFLKVSRTVGRVPQVELPGVLGASHALLLLYEGGLLRTNAKAFLYLAAGRPVLAVMPRESGATAYLEASGVGLVVEPRNPSAVAGALLELVKSLKGGRLPEWFRPDWDYIGRFSARATVEVLDRLLT